MNKKEIEITKLKIRNNNLKLRILEISLPWNGNKFTNFWKDLFNNCIEDNEEEIILLEK